jgi:hypothetical protein
MSGNGNSNGIGNVVIDPSSEDISEGSTSVSAQQEQTFYDRGRLEYDLEHHRQSLGKLGGLFGSGATATTNIAGIVVVASLLGLGATFFVNIIDPAGARTLLVGLISSALGYLFGSAQK